MEKLKLHANVHRNDLFELKHLLFFVLLLSILTLPDLAVSSAFVDVVANDIKRREAFIVSSRKTIWVPDNYTKIQDAINNANDGDTIMVSSGTYLEYITLYKSVNLIGEDSLNTVIDGQGSGTVVTVTANNVTVDSFTIKNGKTGINLLHVENCLIRRNNIVNNSKDGIDIASSRNCTIIENNSSNNNDRGIAVGNSWNCSVEGNIVKKNEGYGLNLYSSWNCSVAGNTVQGGQKDWDTIGLYSCTDCVVFGNTANDSHRTGIWLEDSHDCLVDKNLANNNWYGIALESNSTKCIIRQNEVRDSRGYSLGLHSSSMNTFYHNNFVTTVTRQAESTDSVNVMDNGAEGNYWSDYNGADNDNDGIGDTAYIIDNDELDNYPLMARFTSFPISHLSGIQDVEAVSNSTISNFEFDANKNEIRFNVSGENNTYGFCRIGIPKVLMNGTLVVRIDGNAPITQKKLEQSNLAFNYLYFIYIHSMHQVTITLEAHQDFLSQILVPLLLVSAVAIVALVLFVVKRKRLHLHMRRKR